MNLRDGKKRKPCRAGLTFVELLLAISVVMMIVLALSAVTTAVTSGYEYSTGYSEILQQVRVALSRIERTAKTATASESFPGMLVVPQTSGSYEYPDAVVLWNPDSGTAANPDGLPRMNEIVVFRTHPYSPNQLIEMRYPNDTNEVPDPADLTEWRELLDDYLAAQSGAGGSISDFESWERPSVAVLTERVRTALAGDSIYSNGATAIGAVRFEVRLSPNDEDLTYYEAGKLTWGELPWPQGVYSTSSGMRQAWLRTEIQLLPDVGENTADPIPFFGSAALYYDLSP